MDGFFSARFSCLLTDMSEKFRENSGTFPENFPQFFRKWVQHYIALHSGVEGRCKGGTAPGGNLEGTVKWGWMTTTKNG